MDIMLLEAHCFDKLPNYIDITSPITGDDFNPDVECDDTGQTCLALFGRTSIGDSVCVIYNEYLPWSRILSMNEDLDVNTVKKHVIQSLCLEYNDVKVTEELRPKFFGFVPGLDGAKKFQCFKIYFKSFELVRKFENIWRFSGTFKKSKVASGSIHFLTSHFESTDFNTPSNIKALNELNITPSSWFRVNEPIKSSRRYTTCKVEGLIKSIEPLQNIGLAPIKILSFDAEMYSHDNGFPDVMHGDFTTAICASIMTYGSSERRRKAFVLWDGPLEVKTPNMTVEYADSKDELLEKFRDFVALEDPDLITGWNIYGFDMPFLWDQYEASHSKRSERGSEQMRLEMCKKLGREFFTVKDLSSKCPSFDSSKSIQQIRWQLAAKKPDQFPERIASNTRGVLRAKLNMQSEDSNFSLQDFETLKNSNIQYFNAVMHDPRRESGRRFEYLSRFICEKSQLSEKRMASSAKGDNTYYFWSGRTCVDLMQIIKDDKKLDENTLKFCAQTFLDPEYGKIDFSPAEIFKAYREKDATKMSAMIDYCARDADIPLDLIQKLSYIAQWFEMSRVTFTPIAQVLNGGQQRKVFNLISHFVHNSHAMNTGLTDWPQSNDDGSSDYQGATVIEPKTGFYTESVSTLDFESLYPSIIIHFNLCPSVYVRKGLTVPESFCVEQHLITHTIQDRTFEQSYGFVKNVQGIIPQLLQSLLKSRKLAKKAMNSAPNEFEKAVQNGRQLALKISCNSVYGFFGVNEKRGLLSCKPIAAVTTLRGRSFIEAAKNYVESFYKGSQVLYGDTDSIMIKWSSTEDITISKAYKLAEEASASITQLLRNGLVEGASKPMLESAVSAVTLANEKVYSPYLLIQKKTYAGLKYELKSGHSADSDADFSQCIDMKGIDAVRRDRSKLVKTISGNILQSLLFKKDIKSAIQGLLEDVTKVADGSAPLDWFVLSKSLKGTYKTENQPHVQAWLRMTKRGDDEVPEIGSRMPYIIVHSKKKGPLYEQTEHPDYVRRAGLKYCPKYYLENARDVVERLLSPTTEAHKVTQIFSNALQAADRRTSGNMSLLSFFKKI